jgi:tetratricopeptide (TPR) repeat protein
MNVFLRLALVWLFFFASGLTTQADEVSRIDAALALSQNTGRPVLAVAGSKACGPCQALKKRLYTEAGLQPLIAQFIPLELSTDEEGHDEWVTWERKFPSEGNGIPKLYVVRADGEKLYAASAPDELPQFLQLHLQQSGQPVTDKQNRQIDSLVTAATKLSESGDLAGAVLKLKPALKVESFARSAKAAQDLYRSFAEKAQAAVDEAEANFGKGTEGMAAAVTLVQTARVYTKSLPEVAKDANQKLIEHRKDADHRELLRQAELICYANVVAKQSPSKGLTMFRTIADKHSGTPAAELAEARIAELEGAGTTSSSKPLEDFLEAEPSTGADPKKAASQLRLARTFAQNRPEKAREYAKQVIELAPSSADAKEARQLLEKLK